MTDFRVVHRSISGLVYSPRVPYRDTWSTDPPDPDEKKDADIIPDETLPLPPDEPVKTDPIPEEAP